MLLKSLNLAALILGPESEFQYIPFEIYIKNIKLTDFWQ